MKQAILILVLLGGFEGRAEHAASEGRTRPVADEARPTITGCIGKNNQSEFLDFDLRMGGYELKGSTNPDQGVYRTDSDYGGVSVTRDGARLRNDGQVKIYPRKRKVDGVVLAGVPVGGYTVQKLFTGSLTMDNVTVDGQASAGKLFYNVFTGRYTCQAGKCRFGDYAIGSTDPGRKIVLNYDDFINRNRMRMSMKFGDLDFNGAIRFTDTTRSDGEGNTTVTATRGCFNVNVTRSDGSAPRFAGEDDKTARAFLAWLQLMAFDLFSE